MKDIRSMGSWLAVACTAACASVPDAHTTPQSTSICTELAVDISKAEEARRMGIDAGKDAWKAVVPVVVAARYAKSKSETTAAEDRVKALRAESGRLGCPAG